MSLRPADISQALLDLNPQVVHFSGHGTTAGALCVEDNSGKTHLISPEALSALFEQFSQQVKCVVLNACYSEAQARAIASHIDYVIGMNQTIGDKAAIAFAIGFYQALGANRSIQEAYKLGCVQIRLHNIVEYDVPVLFHELKQPLPLTSSPMAFEHVSRIDFDWITIPGGPFGMGSDQQIDSNARDNEMMLPLKSGHEDKQKTCIIPLEEEHYGKDATKLHRRVQNRSCALV